MLKNKVVRIGTEPTPLRPLAVIYISHHLQSMDIQAHYHIHIIISDDEIMFKVSNLAWYCWCILNV